MDPSTIFRRTQDGETSLTLTIHFRSVDLEVMTFSSGHSGAVRVLREAFRLVGRQKAWFVPKPFHSQNMGAYGTGCIAANGRKSGDLE